MRNKFRDFAGEKYGSLVVKRLHKNRNKQGGILWECECVCGSQKLVTSGNLKHGLVKSCGCKKGNITHGDSYNRIHIIWVGMISRCYDSASISYDNYGGRGIRVCKKWQKYLNFKQWAIENGYQDGLSLERINSNKGYGSQNCTWIERRLQNRNKRNTIYLTVNGIRKTIIEWSEISGIKRYVLIGRLRLGWSHKKSVETPVKIIKYREMKKDKIEEFKARIVKEWKGIPEGAGIYIQYESKTRYYGQWPNGPCTSFVGIPKTHVKKIDNA